jgi:hypothetical protein
MRRLPYATLGLAIATAILVGIVECLLWLPWDLERGIAQHAVQYAAPVPLAPASQPAPVNLSGLRAAPLFYRSRQSVDDAEQIAAAPPRYILLAALTGPAGKSVAYVRPVEGKDVVRVREGDALQSWVVKSIELRRVTVMRHAQLAEIVPAPPSSGGGLIRVPLTRAAAHVPSSHVLGLSGVNASAQSISPVTPPKTP